MFVIVHHSTEGDRPVFVSDRESTCREFIKRRIDHQFTIWRTCNNLEPEVWESFLGGSLEDMEFQEQFRTIA